MTLSEEDLSELVKKYSIIERYTIGENKNHILFYLRNNKEISISIKKINEKFEGLGQLRNLNQRGFGEASSIMKEITELKVADNIIENLLEYNLNRQNR